MQLVVYKLKCLDCGVEYIGKTKRILKERLHSHKSHDESAVYQHIVKTNHRIDFENVQVIDRADTDYKLKLIELQHIIKQKPALNKQMNAQSKYEVKTLIIAAYADQNSTE